MTCIWPGRLEDWRKQQDILVEAYVRAQKRLRLIEEKFNKLENKILAGENQLKKEDEDWEEKRKKKALKLVQRKLKEERQKRLRNKKKYKT